MSRPYALARRVLEEMRQDDPLWFAREDRDRLPVQVLALASDREWRVIKVKP